MLRKLLRSLALALAACASPPAAERVLAQTFPAVGEWQLIGPAYPAAGNTALLTAAPTSAEISQGRTSSQDLCNGANATNNCPGAYFAWAGTAWDPVEHRFYHLRVGGHSGSSGADSYMIDLDDALLGAGWQRIEDVQFANRTVTAGTCEPADGPLALHTYGFPLWLGSGRIMWGGGFSTCVTAPGYGGIANLNTPSTSGLLTFAGTVSDGQTVTIGSRTYTFKGALTPAANEVLIGADQDTSLTNLASAINLTGSPGVQYGAATTLNADVTANADSAVSNTMWVVAKTPGNILGLSETSPNTFWDYPTLKSRLTWTANNPTLQTLAGVSSSALSGPYIFIISSTHGSAQIDKDTLVPVATLGLGSVKHNGTSLPGTSSFNSAMASGGINTNGIYCTGGAASGLGTVTCSDTQGTLNTKGTVTTADDDDTRFGRNIRHPISATCSWLTKGEFAIVSIGDGVFAIWDGFSRNVCLFKPDAQPYNAASDGHICSAAELAGTCGYDGDTWQAFTPPTGPSSTGQIGAYNKMAWWPEKGVLVAYNTMTSGMWMFNPGTGIITPPPVNTAPVAVDDSFSGAEDVAGITGDVCVNDIDAEHDVLSASLLTPPYAGALTLNSNCTFTYVPPANFNGVVPFEYRVSDGFLTDIGVATITVTATNDPPVAVADSYTGAVNEVIGGNVLTNDSDPVEGSPLTASLVTPPSSGTLTFNSNGQFTYTPTSGFSGSVNFVYSASDGALSSNATVTITFSGGGGGGGSGDTPDFLARASAPGVIFSQGFNAEIPVSSSATEGKYLNQDATANKVMPVVQNGHMHFTINSLTNSGDAGQYYVQYADLLGHGTGLGESIYIQWRQYLPASLQDQAFQAETNASSGWNGSYTTNKLIIVSGSGESSCDQGHFVITRYTWRLDTVPTEHGNYAMYNNCGPYENIEQQNVSGGTLFDSQPIISSYTTKRDEMIAAKVFNARAPSLSHQCWRNHRTNCVITPDDTWVTFQLALVFDTSAFLYQTNSGTTIYTRIPTHVTLTQCYGGSCQTIMDTVKGSPGVNTPRGRVWFLPYMTKKNRQQVHPNTYTDVDEVIVSTQPIPDPLE